MAVMFEPDVLAALVSLADCKRGKMMYLSNDKYIGHSLETFGEFSEGEVYLWEQIVKPGMVAIDVGANIGAHTVALAGLVGGSGAVLAFEPIRFMFYLLCGNLALNGLANVRAYHYALGKVPRGIRVPDFDFTESANYGGTPLGAFDHGEIVPCVNLDAMPLRRCDFIKVDVEGMEQEVLEGARQHIATFRPVLYVENNGGEKGPPLIQCIRDMGYDLYWHKPALNPDEEFFSHNMLCLPGGSPPPSDMEPV